MTGFAFLSIERAYEEQSMFLLAVHHSVAYDIGYALGFSFAVLVVLTLLIGIPVALCFLAWNYWQQKRQAKLR